MILEGEIRDAKMNSFSSNFQTRQTLVKHKLPLYFLYEFLMVENLTSAIREHGLNENLGLVI